MGNKIPTVKQVAWISIFPHLLVMGCLFLIWYPFSEKNLVIFGALTYIALSQLLRRFVPDEHRKGLSLVQSENFEEAIPHFQKSYSFFKKNEWIDLYRYATLLSSSKTSYREMALINIAFCYGQLDKGKQSEECYKQALKEFPESTMAKVGLRHLNAFKSVSSSNT